ncbi:MAG: trehalose-phosphatase [Betaproteobacteria bacterium]|nr:trehalose-phosphatase [Betaproteobacteria bacterium]MDH5220905.1 trehalose-phosphatase [Betaproteobacteria bacterium]MDH5352407.1 trehalose-phosphatase [Betaproteobacteria bacterium]
MTRATPEAIRTAAGSRSLALFLDYDGTLTPIVERPEDAVLAEPMRDVLRRVAARYTVAVVSGRDLEDVRARVGLENIHYAGCHGFEIAGPRGNRVHEAAAAAAPQLGAAADMVAHDTRGIPGVQLERKRFTLAVHYRRAPEARVRDVHEAVLRAQARHPALRVTEGKKVYELQPDVDWDKGRAVLWLIETLKLEDAMSVYIGDDVTDEDAFRALAHRGLGIAVQDAPRPTAATLTLRDPEEVRALLAGL